MYSYKYEYLNHQNTISRHGSYIGKATNINIWIIDIDIKMKYIYTTT